MLQSFLFKISDHRRRQGRRYLLGHILLFSVFALLGGATSYRKIHRFIAEHYSTLRDHFGLTWKGIPAYTTIRSIIQGVSSWELEEQFRAYSGHLAGRNESLRFVAIDGKALRGSFDHFRDQQAIQILSAFVADRQIILAHEEIATKTNEIPTAQALMKQLGLSRCVFTLDAIHCQPKTLQAAQATGNEAMVQVKANQQTLLNDCKTTAQTICPSGVYQEPVTKTRNRIECRQCSVFSDMTITDGNKWQAVKTIVKVDRIRCVLDTKARCWKQSDETAFYIATLALDAETCCQAIRNHWGIENRNHYVRDVTMQEDKSRIRINPNIVAKLRSFALNILRANYVQNVSLELFSNAINLHNILDYKGVT